MLAGLTLTASCLDLPESMYISLELIFRDEILTTGVTYTQQLPLTLLPSFDVAVILHLPVLNANISPASSTMAIDSLDDDQSTSLIVALSGSTAALTMYESPTSILTVSGSTVILVTGFTTWTIHVSYTPLPSAAVAVITALPTVLPDRLPSLSTEHIPLSEDDHTIPLLVAVDVSTTAVRVPVSPTLRNFSCSLNVILETYSLTTIVHVAVR